jgi:putative antitoxin of VapBC-like toxin-antitoxin system
MKTTIEIPDSLLDEAKKIASRQGTTLRVLVEAGLRKEVRERRGKKSFRLRRASFRGRGLRPELRGASWDRIRDMAYEGTGR